MAGCAKLERLAICLGYRQPETVIAWHRKGSGCSGRGESHGQPGDRPVPKDVELVGK